MTYEELGLIIQHMTPEQRQCPAIVCDNNEGETSEIESIIPVEQFNGDETPNQLAIWLEQ